jgi:hypothetical protein
MRRSTVMGGGGRRARLIGRGIVVASLAFAVFVFGPRLSTGAAAIHVEPLLVDRITVCGRHYAGRSPARTLESIAADGVPIVLVDPGPFGLIPSCPGPDAFGNRPCTQVAMPGPCATVVYVRVGDDAFRGYALSGGP